MILYYKAGCYLGQISCGNSDGLCSTFDYTTIREQRSPYLIMQQNRIPLIG
ncbi:hypothetical protein [Calothrix sp. 336/3]|uniref:hypothetical protein n=1 Tax=Calothrix sp. 336/3 TaxID=1337936 RepID=UPI000A58DB67|nr:hypothetical protein [Calothrix sp. 336/3]